MGPDKIENGVGGGVHGFVHFWSGFEDAPRKRVPFRSALTNMGATMLDRPELLGGFLFGVPGKACPKLLRDISARNVRKSFRVARAVVDLGSKVH